MYKVVNKTNVALLTICIAFLFPGKVLGDEFWSVRSDRVNVRKGPGTNYPTLFLANNGYPIRILSHSKNWYNIREYQGETGWIHKDFIRRVRYVIVNAGTKNSRIHVREKGNTNSRIIAKATHSSVFKYIKKEKGWVNVRHESGITGWIRADLVWGD